MALSRLLLYLILLGPVFYLFQYCNAPTPGNVIQYLLFNTFIFISFLNSGKKFSFLSPLNLFGTSFFIHLILGQLVWILKEVYLFNNEGRPIEASQYYLLISLVFFFLSERKRLVFRGTFLVDNYIVLNFKYPIFTRFFVVITFTYIGLYIYTAGFTIIPMLSSNIDEARFKLMQEKGSRGFGSILLLTGIHSIFRLRFMKLNILLKSFLYIVLFLPYFFYGGRLLLILPFIICGLNYMYSIKFSYSTFIKGTIGILAFLFVVNYFGTIRQFGSFSTESFILYSWGDSFNEFQHSAHALKYGRNHFGDDFFQTFLSSFLPSSIFNAFELNKDDYFKPIGYLVNQNTIFENTPEVGIRLSLFGELLMCSSLVSFLFAAVIFCLIFKFDWSFTIEADWTFNKYIAMLIGLFSAISIPYGLSFISMSIQFILFSILLFKLDIKRGNENFAN